MKVLPSSKKYTDNKYELYLSSFRSEFNDYFLQVNVTSLPNHVTSNTEQMVHFILCQGT